DKGTPTSGDSSDTGVLDVGETWTWTYTHTVTQTEIDSNGGGDGALTNVATATSHDVSSTSSSASVPVDYNPAWDIHKAASVNESTHQVEHAGDIVTYTVTLKNDGNVDLTQVDLKDALEGAGGVDKGTPTSGDTSDTGVLDVGETWTWTYTHTVTQTEIDSNGGGDGVLTNVATATSHDVSSTSSSASVPVDYNPDWLI